MAASERVTFLLGGAALGAISMAAYHKMNQPKPLPAVVRPPSPPTSATAPVPAVKKPMANAMDLRENARHIVPFGMPGPVNDVVYRNSYVTSYNRRDRNPNWVAEHITTETLKRAEGVDRANSKFKEDDQIPVQFRARLQDYVKSGFDRGHMVPAADVKNSQAGMDDTFYLTNIAPQVGEGFNRDYWAHVETFCRSLASKFSNVYVFTGPLYLPHQEQDGKFYVKYQMIGNPPNVAVPTHFYKVILTETNGKFSVGAFVLPNQTIADSTPLEAFKVPLDAVERGTGLTFFDRLGPNKANVPDLCKQTKCEIVLSKFHQAKKNAELSA